MASVGHIAVGVAAARLRDAPRIPGWRPMVWWSALSLLPDADVIGFALGIPYADPWGHRGATHSLAFAIGVAALIGCAALWRKRPAVRTSCLAFAVLVSHAVLDTLTDGGLGCALFWPFDDTRYFAPWRPLPVAPIGLGYVSVDGATIALIELVFFGPLVLALRRRAAPIKRKTIAVGMSCWLVAVWLLSSTDAVRDAIVGAVVGEETEYAAGYTDAAFRAVARGQSPHEVQGRLGPPVAEGWFYAAKDGPFESAAERSAAAMPRECLTVIIERGAVATAVDGESCTRLGVRAGLSRGEAARLLPAPPESCWRYSGSPGGKSHRVRMVCFANGTVDTVVRQWHWSWD